jgi:hypothetical protein
MTAVTHTVEIQSALEEAGLNVRVVGGDAVQHLFLSDTRDEIQVLELLGKEQHIAIYRGADLPEKFRLAHPTRVGDIVITTKPPFSLRKSDSLLNVSQDPELDLMDRPLGFHGYSPAHPDMGGIFLALGHQVNRQRLGTVHQLNVAPTITSLLGIEAPLHATQGPVSLKD